MTSVSMDVVTDPSPVNTESAGVEDAESSQGGKPAQPEPGKDLTSLYFSQCDFAALPLSTLGNGSATCTVYLHGKCTASTGRSFVREQQQRQHNHM